VLTLPTMKTMSRTTIVALTIGVAIAIFVGVCVFVSHTRNKAFDLVKVGDTESAVVTLFGAEPSVRQRLGVSFARYAATSCSSPCVERLWFENRFLLDTEAWSIDVDQERRVLDKAHWVSP
jgi:hypothetical protein